MPESRACLALCTAAFVLLSACTPAQPPAPTAAPTSPPTKLNVGYSNLSADDLASWVALEGGYFAQNGLDVNLTQGSGGSNAMAALLSGGQDISLQGGAEVLSATTSGADLVVLATLAPVFPYLVEVAPDIQSANDLRGKKLQISSAGSSGDIATRVALKAQGLDPDVDVTLVPVGSHTNGTAAMLGGAVQGGLDDPPASYELERHGLHPIFDLAGQKLPAVNTVVAAQRPWVNDHHDVAQHFVDALVQGIARARTDKAFTVGVLKKYFKSDDDEAMNGTYDFFVKEVLPSSPFPRAEQFSNVLAILEPKNEKLKSVDLGKVVDPTFVQSAVDRGLAAPN
ncbi:MAG: ABC transporter substrate-binding protein [Chloroflexi bacterium]|nr:ABC transporter substrate-binding protein [Chloroflexota bacterium]